MVLSTYKKSAYTGLLISFLLFSCQNMINTILKPSKIELVPKYSCALAMGEKKEPVLVEKVPLVLSINFDSEGNKKKLEAKSKREGREFSMCEDELYFLIKDIKISGGSGKLYFKNKNGELGNEFLIGTKIRHKDTLLYYIPDQNDTCTSHKITISAIVYDSRYGGTEGVHPEIFSIRLSEPLFNVSAAMDKKMVYVEDQNVGCTLTIESDNILAQKQNYKIVNTRIENGKGTLYIKTDSGSEPVHIGMTLPFGTTNLLYFPEKGHDGKHTIILEISNKKEGSIKKISLNVEVQDHRVDEFIAILEPLSDDGSILPHSVQHYVLRIDPTTKGNDKLSYKVKAMETKIGEFKRGDEVVQNGTIFRALTNPLTFHPNGEIGNCKVKMVLENSKGDECNVTLTRDIISTKPEFKIESILVNKKINIKITDPHNNRNDKWALSSYRISGCLEGKLTAIDGTEIENNHPLHVGDNMFEFKISNIDYVSKLPYLKVSIRYPDGEEKEIDPIDISYFFLKAFKEPMNRLKDETHYFVQPIAYMEDPYMAIRERKDKLDIWIDKYKELKNKIAYVLSNSTYRNTANTKIDELNNLHTTVKGYINKCAHMTSQLYRLHKNIDVVNINQNPVERDMLTSRLEQEISRVSSSTTHIDSNISLAIMGDMGDHSNILQYSTSETDRLKQQIEALKRRTRELEDEARVNEANRQSSSHAALQSELNRNNTDIRNSLRSEFKQEATSLTNSFNRAMDQNNNTMYRAMDNHSNAIRNGIEKYDKHINTRFKETNNTMRAIDSKVVNNAHFWKRNKKTREENLYKSITFGQERMPSISWQ